MSELDQRICPNCGEPYRSVTCCSSYPAIVHEERMAKLRGATLDQHPDLTQMAKDRNLEQQGIHKTFGIRPLPTIHTLPNGDEQINLDEGRDVEQANYEGGPFSIEDGNVCAARSRMKFVRSAEIEELEQLLRSMLRDYLPKYAEIDIYHPYLRMAEILGIDLSIGSKDEPT